MTHKLQEEIALALQQLSNTIQKYTDLCREDMNRHYAMHVQHQMLDNDD
jgi:hypothetical protein